MSAQAITRPTPPTDQTTTRQTALQPLIARRQLATPYVQGDFARGQRAHDIPVAAVGTYATRVND